ncbi:branched-chain amino acid transporter permease [Corynebacterium urinipleomorphum]|uniref:branched-chain amino acid transporter permease n=1 Tax=Corynebacterium urinipleomorphum TaxID=1852380 RepID=UPI000B35AE8E|nr:AzlD domain-containing protein [Corynebacterium urinipleomorphum]
MGLPTGVSLSMVAAVLIPVCVVTILLRALPFSFLRLLKGSPVIQFLGATMPVGVMTVLVVYTLSSSRENPGGIWAALIAAGITLALHAWKRRAGLSILVGTAIYMVLVNLVF